MSKSTIVTTANEQLLQLMPDAMKVIEETIKESCDAPWSKDALHTSVWLIEKLTGKAKTEEAQTDSGLMRQLLQMIQDKDRRSALEAISRDTKQESLTETKDPVDSFVEQS
jgi:hypothetical protein